MGDQREGTCFYVGTVAGEYGDMEHPCLVESDDVTSEPRHWLAGLRGKRVRITVEVIE